MSEKAKRTRRAAPGDIRRRRPATITTLFTALDENGDEILDADGEPEFLQYDIVRMSAAGFRELRKSLDSEGNATDEEAFQRTLVRHCVVEPKLTDAQIEDMQAEGLPWADLVAQISTVNGFSTKAKDEAKRTFRPGPGGPEETPAGS